ncbi:hypothetical protein M0R45_036615 [Rubus argutus]|uniref:DUF4220 domain-containing protein n=1 Tax=Rubus argutus TaxID=59490 RepID=A0AAW1W0Z3_RUBAR
MTLPDFNSVRKIWDDRKISGFVLLSLSLQILLTVCAPLRKRTSRMWIMSSIIWLAYMLADLVANFAIGLIASSQCGVLKPALSTEVVATLNAFVQSLGPTNKLRFPTLALFLIGIIKCSERTRALYLGSFDGLKNSVKEDGLKNSVKGENECRIDISHPPYQENNIGVVQCAYDLFERFSKVLIADLLYKSRDNICHMDSTSFFCRRSPEESFHIIAAELNFIYETLFTKLYVAHTKLGYFFRAMSFGTTSTALVCFSKFDKHDLDRFDVVITYSLICGAMALDSIALFMLIFSDWTVAFAAPKDVVQSNISWQSCWKTILVRYLDLKKPNLCSSNTTSSFLGWSRQILFGRCSETIYAFNLIEYALKKGAKWGSLFGLEDLLDKIKIINYGYSKPLSKDLWEFIFNDLREKKNNREGFFELWDAKGDWILRYNDRLRRYVFDHDYDENLLLWHIATELCYNTDKSNAGVDNRRREYSKTLSDYMFYLLFLQPTMMSSVTTIGQEAVLSDTCDAIAQIIFRDNSEPRLVLEHEEACKRILVARPSSIRDKYSAYLLFIARDLAEELTKLGDKKWDVMSQVWVDLLSYAATHCRPNSYAQLLSNGGELVAFVWLVMEHLEVGRK